MQRNFPFFSLSLQVCLSGFLIYIPISVEMAALAWWHNPKKLDLANFISSASCAPGSRLHQRKVKWKCCIKPLIRVEHIRIIPHAQSGSCYAAACVALLAVEFLPLIGECECLVHSVIFDMVYAFESWRFFFFLLRAGVLCSSRCKAGRPKSHHVP